MSKPAYKEVEGVRRKAVVFLVLCKNGDPHRGVGTYPDHCGAQGVATQIDSGKPVCGPHQAAAYGPLS